MVTGLPRENINVSTVRADYAVQMMLRGMHDVDDPEFQILCSAVSELKRLYIIERFAHDACYAQDDSHVRTELNNLKAFLERKDASPET